MLQNPVRDHLEQLLLDRLADINRTFHNILALGFHERALPSPVGQVSAPSSPLPAAGAQGVAAPAPPECIVASCVLAAHPNAPELLLEWGRILGPDGVLLATTFGAQTGAEYLGNLPNLPIWPDVRDVGNALNKLGFALPVVDRELITLTFPTPNRLITTLTPLGVLPEDVDFKYFSPRTDGVCPFTLEVLTLTAWRPSNTQPKPLKPGQFAIPLGAVLGGSHPDKK